MNAAEVRHLLICYIG